MVVLGRFIALLGIVLLGVYGCGPRMTWPAPELRALLQFVAYTPGEYLSERLGNSDAGFLGIGTRQGCREYQANQSLDDIQQFYLQLGRRHGWTVQSNRSVGTQIKGEPSIVRIINLSRPRYNVDVHLSTLQQRFEAFGPLMTSPATPESPAPGSQESRATPPFFLYLVAAIQS